MKKIFSLLLIFSILVPITGTFTWLKIETNLVKKGVKRKLVEGIDKAELTELTFQDSEINTNLNWHHDKEFEFQGEMYDVVYTENTDGKTTYFCWWDKAETELNQSINQLVENSLRHNKSHHTQKKQIQNFVLGLYFTEIQKQTHHSFDLNIKHSFCYNFMLKTHKINTDSPPPKFC